MPPYNLCFGCNDVIMDSTPDAMIVSVDGTRMHKRCHRSYLTGRLYLTGRQGQVSENRTTYGVSCSCATLLVSFGVIVIFLLFAWFAVGAR